MIEDAPGCCGITYAGSNRLFYCDGQSIRGCLTTGKEGAASREDLFQVQEAPGACGITMGGFVMGAGDRILWTDGQSVRSCGCTGKDAMVIVENAPHACGITAAQRADGSVQASLLSTLECPPGNPRDRVWGILG